MRGKYLTGYEIRDTSIWAEWFKIRSNCDVLWIQRIETSVSAKGRELFSYANRTVASLAGLCSMLNECNVSKSVSEMWGCYRRIAEDSNNVDWYLLGFQKKKNVATSFSGSSSPQLRLFDLKRPSKNRPLFASLHRVTSKKSWFLSPLFRQRIPCIKSCSSTCQTSASQHVWHHRLLIKPYYICRITP